MSRSPRFLVPGCIALLVSSCGDELLSPDRQRQSDALSARAVTPSLSTWPVSASRIDLSWADNLRNETGWEVHRSTTGAGGAFTLLASLVVNSTFYSNSGLDELTEYCYKVRSFKRNGGNTSFGSFTPEACSTTFGRPAAPSNASAVPASSSVVNLSWVDNANTETAIRLERAADADGPWQVAANLAANVQSYTDYGRVADDPLCYRVIATNPNGESASNVDCTSPPRRPSSIAAAANGARIDVTWTDASNVEDGYGVWRALDNFVFALVATLPANTSTFNDAGISPDTRYWYRVRAIKDGGASDDSDWAWAVVAVGPPRAPENLAARPAGSAAASVGWTNMSPSSTGFRIERSTDGQASWVTAGTAAQNDGGFYDGDRAAERAVCYRVYAANGFGESPPSNVDCTVPPAPPSNVATADNGDGNTLLTWTDNSSVEDAFEIWTMYCYYYYDDTYYCDYWNVYQVAANSTSFVLYLDWNESIAAVYALSDGGYSDPGSWAGTEGASLVSGQRVVRPTKGARAPIPPLSARTKGLRGKPPLGRKLP